MYVRCAEHDDRSGQLDELKFVGPFADRLAAIIWIEQHGGKPYEYDDTHIETWANNPDEPVEVFVIIAEIPVEAP